jgi:hypothetical protein
MTTPTTEHDDRSMLERRANVIRSRLLRTIDALDHKRHQVMDVGTQLKKRAPSLATAAIGIAVIVAGVGLIAYQRSRSRRRDWKSLLAQGIGSFAAPRKPSMMSVALRRAAISLGMLALDRFAKQAVLKFVDKAAGALPDATASKPGADWAATGL